MSAEFSIVAAPRSINPKQIERTALCDKEHTNLPNLFGHLMSGGKTSVLGCV